MLPDGSGSCPTSCSISNYTSCDTSNQCSYCQQNLCTSCLGSLCFQCNSNAKISDDGTCACPVGYALNTISDTCELCDASCLTCSNARDAGSCTSCISPGVIFSLIVKKPTGNYLEGSCLQKCPQGYIRNSNGFCAISCSHGCTDCSEGGNENKCLSCAPGFYLVGISEGPCKAVCPIGTSLGNSLTNCLPCALTCNSCLYPNNNTQCITCNSNNGFLTVMYPTGTGTCTNSCIGNNTYTDSSIMNCYTNGKCPITTYQSVDTLECLQCHSSCFGCKAPKDPNKCRGCKKSTYFLRLQDTSAVTGNCVPNCANTDITDTERYICTPQIISTVEKKTMNSISTTLVSTRLAFLLSYCLVQVFYLADLQSPFFLRDP